MEQNNYLWYIGTKRLYHNIPICSWRCRSQSLCLHNFYHARSL